MSLTNTHLRTPNALSKRTNSTILLSESPSKRSCVNPTMSSSEQRQSQSTSKRNRMVRIREETPHNSMQLHSWTFCAASVAPVRVKDVLRMDAETGRTFAFHSSQSLMVIHNVWADNDFYWMGRVPCRTVKLVGIVVGIDEFDDKYRFKCTLSILISFAQYLWAACNIDIHNSGRWNGCDRLRHQVPEATCNASKGQVCKIKSYLAIHCSTAEIKVASCDRAQARKEAKGPGSSRICRMLCWKDFRRSWFALSTCRAW